MWLATFLSLCGEAERERWAALWALMTNESLSLAGPAVLVLLSHVTSWNRKC